MAVQTTDQQTISELVRKVQELEAKLEALTTRVTALETWKATGSSQTGYYVCNDNATYDATNSKTMTLSNGLITALET